MNVALDLLGGVMHFILYYRLSEWMEAWWTNLTLLVICVLEYITVCTTKLNVYLHASIEHWHKYTWSGAVMQWQDDELILHRICSRALTWCSLVASQWVVDESSPHCVSFTIWCQLCGLARYLWTVFIHHKVVQQMVFAFIGVCSLGYIDVVGW